MKISESSAPLVLLIAPDTPSSDVLREAFSRGSCPVKFRQVGTIAEAKLILAAEFPAVVICQVKLPDGCVEDLMPSLSSETFLVLLGANTSQSPFTRSSCLRSLRIGTFDFVIDDDEHLAVLPALVARWAKMAHASQDRQRQEQLNWMMGKLVEQCHLSHVCASDGAVLGDRKILYVNRAFTEMTGYEPEEVCGCSLDFLWGPNTDAHELDRLQNAIRAGKPCEGEFINYRKDGSEFLIHWVVDPIRDASGEVIYWISRSEDVTHQRAQETELRQLQDQLHEIHRLNAISELTATIAHDVNQPLCAIYNYCAVCIGGLASGKLDREAHLNLLHKLQAEAKSASAVIDSVRQSIRQEQRSWATVSLAKIIEEVQLLVRARQIAAKVELVVEHRDPSLEVFCDRREIQQVLVNLIMNALQAAAFLDRPARVTIRSEPANGQLIRTTIEDNAGGVPSESLMQLFEPFHTTKPDGLGLGLSICRRIIRRYGGTIDAKNVVGGGLSVSFTLPRAAPED